MSAAPQLAGPQASAPALLAEALVHVLVVDDNPAKRLALRSALQPLGHTIVEAGSALDALRHVMAHDFAVILLDVHMPITDGFQTAALIRQRRQSEMTPIIFVTAHARDELTNTDLYAQGAVDFIFAPLSTLELRAKVTVFANLFSKARSLAASARELQSSADRLRLLTDAAPIGIFQTDSDNRYVYTNPRWSEITGIAAEEASGRRWDTIIESEQRDGSSARLPGVPPDRAELSHRFEIQPPGGPARTVVATSRPVPHADGGTAGWVGTLADVTAEAEAEAVMSAARDAEAEASRLKADFLANVSHEIRTPMNGVIGMADLLLETELDARQRDYAQTVHNSGEALMTIIDDILDFSKLEAGKLTIEEIEFDPRAIVDAVVDLLAGLAQAKRLELVAVVESSVPDAVRGDPGRVRQVLTNLIGNAIKFTRAGEVVVRVTATELPGADPVLRFEVSDTGEGIAADKLALVFEPFVQADSSTSRRYGGTGLGLAISSQLVVLMGGACGLASRLGEGSSFWFTVRVQATDGAQPSARAGAPDGRLAGVTALLVDDSATQRGVLATYLADWGMSVTTADSGPTALDAMRSELRSGRPFGVVVLDETMPGMNGLEVRRAIDADPALRANIVLMTELGREPGLAASGSGVCTSLSKPVHREELLACLRVALGLSAAEPGAPETVAERAAPRGGAVAGRLLLAEDNPINQRVALAMLEGAGYRVDSVLDGAEAVQAAAAATYDAILMDCQMPGLNGYEATAAIRAGEGRERHTPIIAMTAGAQRDDRERCLASGMDGYLAKPVRKDALLALLERSLNGALAPAADASGTSGPATSPAAPEAPPAAPEDIRRRPLEEALPAEVAVLDSAIIEQLEQLGEATGEDLIAQLTVIFLADADTQVGGLQRALAERDPPAVVRWAHALGGASGSLGATGLSHLCAVLEEAGASGNVADGRRLLDELEAELGRVRTALVSRMRAAA